MPKPETAQIEEPAEKVIPIADPDGETARSPESVAKRPFVLDKKRGAGGGNMPLMLLILGAIMVFGMGMLVFLSSKERQKRRPQPKPLGRILGGSPAPPLRVT